MGYLWEVNVLVAEENEAATKGQWSEGIQDEVADGLDDWKEAQPCPR